MPRYKPCDYDQLQMVPVSLEQQLVPGTLEYAIHTLIEERIDTSMFDERYQNDEMGRRAYDPKVLLKIVLFAYSRGILHSRPMERACKENITFMALACGQQPDHSTLAAFVSSMGEEKVTALFTQVLMVCQEQGLLGGTHFSLDGLKLTSNASKEWSGKHADLLKKKEALDRKVTEAIEEQRSEDQKDGDPDGHRRKEKVRKLQKDAERIEKFLEENAPKEGKSGDEVQSNITDNDSAKMSTSHGVVQGYNAHAMVDEEHQVILHGEVFGDGSDGTAVEDMLEGTEENLTTIGQEDPLKDQVVSADTGYFTKKNLQACEAAGVDAYIPDRKFRQRDVRFEDAGRYRRPVTNAQKKTSAPKPKRWFTPEDFTFDPERETLICPAGAAMYVKDPNFKTGAGQTGICYQAPAPACKSCKLRAQCQRNPQSKEGRRVAILTGREQKKKLSLTELMKQKIDTPEGRKMYSKRLGIVEPVFGNIRANKRMDRFTLRGRGKVNVQWMLYCLVHNIGKVAHFGPCYAEAV